MVDPLERLEAELAREAAAISEWLVMTGALDFPDYRYHVGKIHGIQSCLRAIVEIQQAMAKDE